MTQPPGIARYGRGIPTPRPKTRIPTWAVVAITILVMGFAVPVAIQTLNALSGDGRAQAPQSQPQAQAPAVDQADFARYWSDNFSATSWYPLTSTPSWDGAALVAHTKLYADQDAREPALAMCRAMVNYWGMRGLEFRPVRVLDRADAILVSAHTASDTCAWRR